MISKTKYPVSDAEIRRAFLKAGLGEAEQIAPLGDGEYNAVYAATANGQPYVIKVAPPGDMPVMAYESDMMTAEVSWYRVIQARTSIRVPAIYAFDDTREILPVPYFIMERLAGDPLNKATLTAAEREQTAALCARMAADIHAVSNDRFGYPQTGLYATWYAAIRAMTKQALHDCRRKGRRSKQGQRFLDAIDRQKAVLEAVPCSMVNFDLWPANLIVQRESNGLALSWIDPERSFWGDRLLDFVCFEFGVPLAKKSATLAAYNAVSAAPITASADETVRYAVGLGYLALIMETEKYFRYSPFHFGWWRNLAMCRFLYGQAFAILEAD